MQYLLKYTLFLIFLVYIINSQTVPTRIFFSDGYAIGAEPDKPIEVVEEQEGIESGGKNWTGIDVSIVGKYAKKYGHPPRKPYINTDQGDLLLFVFTIAGLIGGIIIGYNFRKLFIEKKHDHKIIHHRKTRKVTERQEN